MVSEDLETYTENRQTIVERLSNIGDGREITIEGPQGRYNDEIRVYTHDNIADLGKPTEGTPVINVETATMALLEGQGNPDFQPIKRLWVWE